MFGHEWQRDLADHLAQESVGTLITANSLVLKDAFLAIGGFNESFIYAGGEDTDLGFRLRMIGKLRST